jgi:hypothetical protein
MRRFSLLFCVPILFLSAISERCQGSNRPSDRLFGGKDLRAGQTHSYTSTLKKSSSYNWPIDPADVDIVVRVFLPDGKLAAREYE